MIIRCTQRAELRFRRHLLPHPDLADCIAAVFQLPNAVLHLVDDNSTQYFSNHIRLLDSFSVHYTKRLLRCHDVLNISLQLDITR